MPNTPKSAEELAELKKDELQELARKADVPVSGTKDELVERLADEPEAPANSNVPVSPALAIAVAPASGDNPAVVGSVTVDPVEVDEHTQKDEFDRPYVGADPQFRH